MCDCEPLNLLEAYLASVFKVQLTHTAISLARRTKLATKIGLPSYYILYLFYEPLVLTSSRAFTALHTANNRLKETDQYRNEDAAVLGDHLYRLVLAKRHDRLVAAIARNDEVRYDLSKDMAVFAYGFNESKELGLRTSDFDCVHDHAASKSESEPGAEDDVDVDVDAAAVANNAGGADQFPDNLYEYPDDGAICDHENEEEQEVHNDNTQRSGPETDGMQEHDDQEHRSHEHMDEVQEQHMQTPEAHDQCSRKLLDHEQQDNAEKQEGRRLLVGSAGGNYAEGKGVEDLAATAQMRAAPKSHAGLVAEGQMVSQEQLQG